MALIQGAQTSFPEQAIIFYLRKVFSRVENSVKVDGVEVDVFISEINLCVEYDGLRWHETKYEEDLKKNKALQDRLFVRFREKGLYSLDDFGCLNIPTTPTPRGWKIAFKTLFYILENRGLCSHFGDIDIVRDLGEIESYIDRVVLENSLLNTHPHIAYEWHPTKNGNLRPENIVAGSGREVWWLGDCSHEWSAIVADRVNRGNGCPTCSNHRVLQGFNDLETTNPELATEWHPTKNGELKPTQVTSGSNKSVWWLCSKNTAHEWEALPTSRSSVGTGCPYCAGRKVSEDNCLLNCYPDVAKQWHPTKNGESTPSSTHHGSNSYVWWICSKGHEWEASVINRTRHNSGCPFCAGRGVIEGENDLCTTHPDIANQWHPTKNRQYLPTQFKATSKNRFWFLCSKCEHPDGYTAIIKDKVKRGQRCPHCENGRFAIKYLDFVPDYY